MAKLNELFQQAEKLRKKGLFDDAIELYNQILDEDAQYENIHSILGEIYYIKGDVENAVKNYEAEISKEDNCLTMYRLGIAYYRATRFNLCINKLNSLVDKGCQLDMAYYWIGLAYFHTGRIEASINAFEKLREKMPHNTIGCYNLALAYQTSGNSAKAIEFLNMILEEDSEIASVHYHLAVAYLDELRFQEAIGHLKKVLELDPQYKPAQQKLDMLYNDQEMLYTYGVKMNNETQDDQELNINFHIGEAYKGFNLIDKTFKYLKKLALEKEDNPE